MDPIKVKDIMRPNVVTCLKSDNILDVAKKMVEEDVGSVIVIENQIPVGIITREDIVNKVVAEEKIPIEVKAKEIMSSPVVTCDQEEDINEVAKRMNKYDYLQMPVKHLDKLVGFVSIKDILRAEPGIIDIFTENMNKEPQFEAENEETMSGECELCGNFSENLRYINGRWVCEVCADEAEEL